LFLFTFLPALVTSKIEVIEASVIASFKVLAAFTGFFIFASDQINTDLV